MATAAELKARRDSLERQRASGVARVTFDGRTVEYRSDREIERAISSLNQQIASADNTKRTRIIKPFASKGL